MNIDRQEGNTHIQNILVVPQDTILHSITAVTAIFLPIFKVQGHCIKGTRRVKGLHYYSGNRKIGLSYVRARSPEEKSDLRGAFGLHNPLQTGLSPSLILLEAPTCALAQPVPR